MSTPLEDLFDAITLVVFCCPDLLVAEPFDESVPEAPVLLTRFDGKPIRVLSRKDFEAIRSWGYSKPRAQG